MCGGGDMEERDSSVGVCRGLWRLCYLFFGGVQCSTGTGMTLLTAPLSPTPPLSALIRRQDRSLWHHHLS